MVLLATLGLVCAQKPLVGFTHAAWNFKWPPVAVVIPTGAWAPDTAVLPVTAQGCVTGSGNVLADLPRLDQVSRLGFSDAGSVVFGLLCDPPPAGTTVNVSMAQGAVPMLGGAGESLSASAQLPYVSAFEPDVAPWCGPNGTVGARLVQPVACVVAQPSGVVRGATLDGVTAVPEPSPAPGTGSGSLAIAVGLASAYLGPRAWVSGVPISNQARGPSAVVVVASPGAPSGARTGFSANSGPGCWPWSTTVRMEPLRDANGPWVGLCPSAPTGQALVLSAAPAATSVSNTGGGTLVSHSLIAVLQASLANATRVPPDVPGVDQVQHPRWGRERFTPALATPPANSLGLIGSELPAAAFAAPLGLEGLLVDTLTGVPLGVATVWVAGVTTGWWHGHPTWIGFGHPFTEVAPGADTAWRAFVPSSFANVTAVVTGCGPTPTAAVATQFQYLRGPGVYVAWCGATGTHSLTITPMGTTSELLLPWYGSAGPSSETFPARYTALTQDVVTASDTNSSVRWGSLFAPITPSPSRTPSRTPTRSRSASNSPSSGLASETASVTPTSTPASDSVTASTTASPSESTSLSPSPSPTASVSATASASFVPPSVVQVGFYGLGFAPPSPGTVVISVGPVSGGPLLTINVLGIYVEGCEPGITAEPATQFASEFEITCTPAGSAPVRVTVFEGAAVFGDAGQFRAALVTASLPVRPTPVLGTLGGPAPGVHNGSALKVVATVEWLHEGGCPSPSATEWLSAATLTGGAGWVPDSFFGTWGNEVDPLCGTWVFEGVVQPGSTGFTVTLPTLPWTDAYGDSVPLPGAVLLVQAQAPSRSSSASRSASVSTGASVSVSASGSVSGSRSEIPSLSASRSVSASVPMSASASSSRGVSASGSRSLTATSSGSVSVSKTISRSRSETSSVGSGAGVSTSGSSSTNVGVIAGVAAGVVALAVGVGLYVHFRPKAPTPVFGSGAGANTAVASSAASLDAPAQARSWKRSA